MSFFGSLFGGQNKTLSSDINQTGAAAGYATGLGEKNLSAASSFWNNILSGNQSDIAKSLAPQIGTIQQQKEQQLKSTGEFGNRSGGTNAANQMAGDTARAQINSMVSSLLGSSAGNLASTGSNLLSTGISAIGQQAQLSQVQLKNWENSILGRGLTTAAAAGEGLALGA